MEDAMKTNEKRALLPGTVLNERYVLERVSGEGNFGITYIGWDLLLESRVAVKEFFPVNRVNRNTEKGEVDVYVFQEEDYEQSLHRYLDEGKRLSRLNQIESIVSIRDFFYANHTAYIIMEYIGGVSLKEYIEANGPMPGDVVMGMMSPVLDALEKVHENGIIHRDISPDNIIVTEDGKLVLVDFGSARQVNVVNDRSLTVMIKRGYSSPEQYRSRGEQGAWSDVYAICATIYFMLAGKAPDEAIDRILDDETMSLVDMKEILLPKKMKQAVMKGISLRYHERYQTVSELKAALREAEGTGRKMAVWWKVPVAGVLLIVLSFCLARYVIPSVRETGKTEEVQVSGTESPEPSSAQPALYRMIACEGKTKEQVLQKLQGMAEGAVEVVWKSEYSGTVKKERVIRQSVEPETVYSADAPIILELVVSKGVKTVRVPNVQGKTLAKAKKILTQKELKCKVVRVESREQKGTVISQDKAAGEKCEAGSKIVLKVSRGAEVSTSPPSRPAATAIPSRSAAEKPTSGKSGSTKYDGVIE